ncbi:MAG: peptidoglycan binding domain-containing protein, partial [Candidatus Falkowbacteria bacterium]|nr:peptidoglycan binding domain-containing protein [Candidatus Falkowbacteria bacterium]
MNLFKKTSEPEEVEGNKSRNIFFHLIVGLLVFIIILAIILTIIVFLYLFFDKKYVDRIYPGVHFQEISLSGLTKDGANEVLKNKIKKINDSGVSFFYEDANAKDEKVTRKTTVYPLIASFSGDIAYQVMDFDLSKTVDQAFSIGRSKNPIEALYEKANSYYYSTNIDLVASVNEAQIRQVLQDYFKQYEKPAKNAELIQEKDSRGSIFYSVSKEENGYVIDYDNGINQLKSNLVGLKVTSIELKSMVSSPQVYQADGLRVAEKANSILSFAPFALYFEEYPKFKIPSGEWIVSRDDWADWLLVKKGSSSEAMIGLNEKAQDYLKTKI